MGGSQSTRRLTVPNESAHIIKVSDSVIDRLTNINDNNVSVTSTSPSVVGTPNIPTGSFSGTLTSLRVLQEKEQQLKENDSYWANRVRALENAQSTNARLMEQEFVKTVAAIESTLPKIPQKMSEAPCSDKKAEVLECFRRNPKQILLCSKEVAAFADCVDLKRLTTN